MGDFEFAHGRMKKALDHYEQDLRISSDLARETDGMSRGLAYANYNVGRVLGAMGVERAHEAARYFNQSAQLFERLGDPYNVFQSRVRACEAALAAGEGKSVAALLTAMDSIFSSESGRDKERAITKVLRAQYEHQFNKQSVIALAQVREARHALAQNDRDYYYVRALIAEGKILLATGDRQHARECLFRARDFTESLELEDVRREIERILENENFERNDRTTRTGQFDAAIISARLLGFTRACSAIHPNHQVTFLRELAELFTKRCGLWDGEPLHMFSDSVVSLFCNPSDRAAPHACLALGAAGEISERFTRLREQWASTHPMFGSLRIGFAVTTGPISLVHLGSELRRTVLGEAITEADFLQHAAMDGEILLSTQAAQQVRQYARRLPVTAREVVVGDHPSAMPAYVVRAVEVEPFLRDARMFDTGVFNTLEITHF